MPEIDPPVLELELRPSSTYCTGLWHMPNSKFPQSLTWGLYATLVETEDGSELPELTTAKISVEALEAALASVDDDGVIVGVLPMTARGDYLISGVVVGLKDGPEYPLSVTYNFEVGADGSDITCEGDEADAERIRQGILLSPLVDF